MKFAKVLVPVAVLALALSGCDGAHIRIGDGDGKKLSELDLSGKSPDKLVLAGPDEVRVTRGDKLAIAVEGDPEITGRLRFSLDGDSLGVMREDGTWKDDGGRTAIVNVVMPALHEVTLAGSGKIASATMARDAKVTVAGSGTVESPALAADKLSLTVAGSGTY